MAWLGCCPHSLCLHVEFSLLNRCAANAPLKTCKLQIQPIQSNPSCRPPPQTRHGSRCPALKSNEMIQQLRKRKTTATAVEC